MQTPAKKFIDLLESQQLLSDDIVVELRRQVAESKTKLSPELLAKLLVDNGHLTKFQATKLITEFSEPDPDDRPAEEEELGFAEEAGASDPNSKVAAVFVDDEDDDIAEVEALEEEVEPVDVVEVDAVEEVVEAVEISPTEPEPAAASPLQPVSSPKVIRPTKSKTGSKSNPWDSFRILGVGILLALTLIAGFFLVNYFLRGSAEERIERADSAYEQRSYETAATMYKEFAEVFPTHEKTSYAKVRQALALLRKDSEGAPDPKLGLETALQVLPPVASEAGLTDQQSDLAGALVALAQKFNERADARKETAERKQLMSEMEKLMELINNPQFVGANQRNQQAPSLQRIEEDRQRILREINRDEELTVALQEIDAKLDAQDTLGAYEVRRNLINRYPLLEANESLVARVEKATEIQQSLVGEGTLAIELNTEETPTEAGRSFVLANRSGQAVPSLADQVVFVKVKGSVFGIDGQSGDALWRKFVGRGFDTQPIRLGSGRQVDALLAEPAAGRLSSVAGATGEINWKAEFGEPLLAPVVESDDLFVVTPSGTLASLESSAGQTKWLKHIPQPIEVPPGVAFGKPNLYLPAEHSNLYVFDRQDGTCRQVVYVGHRAGSIVVPPVLLLGQLFVFENINNESARIRIFSVDGEGLNSTPTQAAIPVDGNIVVSPQIDGRRLIVQSDLGQILVLDVEPTAPAEKVTTIAAVPKNLYQPQISWMTASNNKLWVADTRFTRFDMQVSLQKLNRAWIKNDGDQFTGPPQMFDDVIIHTRTLRGNQGVRVAAVRADSGEPLWQTDLGVPVTLLHQAAERQYEAVNSSGSYFTLDNQPIRNQADADPAAGKPAMRFTDPVWLSDSSAVMLNQSKANQLALYSSSGPKLQILTANFGSAAPACRPVAVGDYFAVGLDNGQLVLIDPSNGGLAATPYQPALEPGRKTFWNRPLYVAESQTLIAASGLQKFVRLTVGDSLKVLTEVDLENPCVGPIIQVGSRLAAVESTKAGDSLSFYDATNLTKAVTLPLQGRLVTGPFPVADGCLLQTNAQLVLVQADGSPGWSIDFPNSALVGPPIDREGKWLLLTRSGQVWLVDPTNGQVVGTSDSGQAFTSTPVVLANTLLVGSDEGAVLALPIPTTTTGEQ